MCDKLKLKPSFMSDAAPLKPTLSGALTWLGEGVIGKSNHLRGNEQNYSVSILYVGRDHDPAMSIEMPSRLKLTVIHPTSSLCL